ncbi:hypothetical protein ASPCADRAFT_207387 [Aspergillus carbonarius ITEM 5010]|uniref:Uncharacterized protein n=1 Tax=Aspergillus carbonarius (strain ITEM 5010) TaxID=602072 RepID=A0A1R3RNI5_ASPC5|nr:hypothetical protein ASPCADRAFT_207387 [Aspergillus carbonarius ITEM 5010]
MHPHTAPKNSGQMIAYDCDSSLRGIQPVLPISEADSTSYCRKLLKLGKLLWKKALSAKILG